MKILKLHEIRKESIKNELSNAIKSGKIFVYPTDTLYGIGCNAEVTESVKKIFDAKKREHDKPVSVIVPSKEWIFENLILTDVNRKFVDNLLPGPYTIVARTKLRIPYIVSKDGKIGVRIPKNEFCDFIRKQNVLFVTTSVNISKEEPITKIGEIPESIKQIVDYAIDAGEINGEGSRVFDVSGKNLVILRW